MNQSTNTVVRRGRSEAVFATNKIIDYYHIVSMMMKNVWKILVSDERWLAGKKIATCNLLQLFMLLRFFSHCNLEQIQG